MSHSPALRLAIRHLMSWGVGDPLPVEGSAPAEGCTTVVVEAAEHLASVLASDVVGAATLVFAPAAPGSSPPAGGAVVTYEGSLREPGGDLSLDDEFFLQTQDYSTSEYLVVMGPTLVRVMSEADFEAFLGDADRARHEGAFPTFLTAPAVRLADPGALGGPADADGPRTRLYVDASGVVSTGPAGAPLGGIEAGLVGLQRAWSECNAASSQPCAVSLGAVVPEAVRIAALAERPWLGRYLATVELLRNLAARGIGPLQVSGFGGRLSAGLADLDDAADADDPAQPVLLWSDDAT
jgi:hypothetical protein